MPSLIARVLLFLSSYFPLSVVFFVLLLRNEAGLAAAILAIGLLSVAGLAIYLRSLHSIAPMLVQVGAVQRRDREIIAYLLSYVIPYLAVPFNGLERGIGLGIFFCVIGFLYVRANMIHINPMLTLLGYRLYDVTLDNGGVHALITKSRVVRRGEMQVVKIGDDILFERQQGQGAM